MATSTKHHPIANLNAGLIPGVTKLQHLSVIAWRIEAIRARRIVPDSEGPSVSGKAWVTVVSFQGPGKRIAGEERQGAFEQTDYRLHVQSDGEERSWLLGSSIGALSGIATRLFWSRPWHLGAMEFQLSYDEGAERYQDYLLQTESQWASSRWKIRDTGIPARESIFELKLPGWCGAEMRDHYLRPDGSTGVSRTIWDDDYGTTGSLTVGRCELLERLGLLTAREMQFPEFVRLHRRVGVRFEPARLLNRGVETGGVLARCA